MPRERFFVEVAPGYLRLRHQFGLKTKFGRGRLGPLMDQVVRQLEDLEEAGESVEFAPLDPNEEAEILAAEEAERRWNEELFLDTLDPDEVADYFEGQELEAARKAAGERCGAGCFRCHSNCSATDRCGSPSPIQVTGGPGCPTLERHRRAFGENMVPGLWRAARRLLVQGVPAGRGAPAPSPVDEGPRRYVRS
jgi:hypothetical protein